MSRLFVLLALAVVPATSFGQDWFQADRNVALPGSGISGPAQPAFDLPRSQSPVHRFMVGERSDVSASRDSLGWSSLFE